MIDNQMSKTGFQKALKESERKRLEKLLASQMSAVRLPDAVRQHRFHPTRRWQFDFSYPEIKLAIEVEGGTWVNGAHNRGAHYESDCEKYNAAALLGWVVLRYTTNMVRDGKAIDQIESAYKMMSKKK